MDLNREGVSHCLSPPFMFVKAFAIAKQLKMAPKAQNRKLHPWDWLEVFMA